MKLIQHTENLEFRIKKRASETPEIMLNFASIPYTVIYHLTDFVNGQIQQVKKRHYKKNGIPYTWLCAERYKGDPFFDHLHYCVRTDKFVPGCL